MLCDLCSVIPQENQSFGMMLLFMYNVKACVLSFLCMFGSYCSTYGQVKGPTIHGILRGKYEYQPDLDASRFEVRNARLSAEGSLPYRSSYKLEVDLCDESSIKMKDAWVRVNPNSLTAVRST